MKELDLEYDEDIQDIQDVEEKEVLAEKLADIEADDLSGIDDDELKQKRDANIIRDVLDQNVTTQRKLSDSRAMWNVERDVEKENCILKDDAEFKVRYKSSDENIIYSGKEFKEYMNKKYGQDYVTYSHREPDFEPFEQVIDKADFEEFLFDKYGEHISVQDVPDGHFNIEHMESDRKNTYNVANGHCIDVMGVDISQKDIEEYMKQKDLTWHECGNRQTIRMVPTEINQVFAHTGGIGIEKDFETLQNELRDIALDDEGNVHKFSLKKESPVGDTENLENAIKDRHEKNIQRKKEMF